MKTKEYVRKYRLSETDQFNHNEFVQDLTFDFVSLLEVGKATDNVKGFENAVRAIRMKWDSINNKTVGQLPDKLWKYFYATVIIKTKKELFPEFMEAKEREKKERQKRWEQERKWREQEERAWDDFFFGFLFGGFKSTRPVESFAVLGVESDASEDEVKKAYRQLSLKHHPDKGGTQDKFIQITDAKNRCLQYLQAS